MVAVFAIFATLGMLDFKMMGVGLAVAVLHRRDDRPRGAAAGHDEAARRLELVPAALAGMAAAPEPRGPGPARPEPEPEPEPEPRVPTAV